MPTALVVGASRGLGRALVEKHLKRGWTVIATVRQEDALDGIAIDALTVERLDVTDWSAVDALGERLGGRALDLLFVNAGVAGPPGAIGEAEPDAFAELMLVNALAPCRIVERLADRTADTATIAIMSSEMGSIAGNTSGGMDAYRISKTAVNQGLHCIAMRRADERTYLSCHPGWVRTDMGGDRAPLSPEESAAGLADMLAARAGTGGHAFVNYRNEALPW